MAVLISGWIAGLLYEVFNVPLGVWRYENWPFAAWQVFQVPVVVILMWPVHYLPAFSLYRIFYKKETEKLWE